MLLRVWRLIVALVLSVGSLLGLAILGFRDDPFNARPFNQTEWANADMEDRGKMARDAIRHLPPGTTKERVRDLLGKGEQPPRDPRGPVDGFGNRLDHPETWAYYLGSYSGVGLYRFDSAFLYVHFNQDGRVILAEITGG